MTTFLYMIVLGTTITNEVSIFKTCEQHNQDIGKAIEEINDCRNEIDQSQAKLEKLQNDVAEYREMCSLPEHVC